MHFKISPGDSQLPLVSEIPSYNGIARLEGLNGTGKSLSTEILALCAGRRLSSGEAWATLCEGLGEVTVEAFELEGAATVVWRLTGSNMSSADPDDPMSWFDSIQIDGKEVSSFHQVRDLLSVEILKGDVGLVETLASQIDEEARRAESLASASYASESERLGELLESLRDQIGRFNATDIRGRAKELGACREQLEVARAELKAQGERADRLGRALELSTSLEVTRASASEIEAEIIDLEAEVQEREASRSEVLAELAVLEQSAIDTVAAASELKKAETSRKRALTAVSNRANELKDLVEAAALAEGQPVDAAIAERQLELQTATRERLALDARPAVVSLIEEIASPLQAADEMGLGEQPLLEMPAGGTLAVVETLEGLQAHRGALMVQSSPAATQPLDDRIARLEAQLKALSAVGAARTKHESATQRLSDTDTRIAELNSQLDKKSAKALESLRSRRASLDLDLIDRGGRLRILKQRASRLPTKTQRDDQTAWLSQELAALGLAEADLPNETEAAYREAAESARQLDRDQARAAELEHEHARDQRELSAMRKALSAPSFSWLGPVATAHGSTDTVDELLDLLEQATSVLEFADRAYDGLRAVIQGVPTTLKAIANELRGRPEASTFARDPLELWAASLAAAWFEQGEVGDLLLEPGARDIAVDIDTKIVRWRVDGEARERRRPLNVLSSGQQAFTFTRARLAILQQRARESANRLLVLDEYGAFVSHDRLRLLENLLIEWHHEHSTDQILLILPAVQDYAALVPTALGDQQALYETRAQALDKPGYFTEELTPA
jgi:hypothetical protein